MLDVGAPKFKKQALEVVRNFSTPLSSTDKARKARDV